MSNIREKYIKYYKLAIHLAELFSKDPDKKVGCILLSDTFTILSTGINGFSRNINDDIKIRWERPLKYSYILHAEENAIANAAREGVKINKSIAITTLFPCNNCAKLLIQSGIKKIISLKPDLEHIRWGESFNKAMNLFNELKIDMILLNKDEII